MKVISVLNQKGGVGKTTISVNLAAALQNKGYSVLLVDADPQGSSLDWFASRGDGEMLFPVVSCPKSNLHKVIADLGRGRDIVVIDGAPRVTDLSRAAMMASDLVLIPVQPSPYDVWAAEEVVKLIKEAQIYRPQLQAAFVINRKIAKTAIGRDIVDALEEFELPILSAALAQRVVYAESAANGRAVFEDDKRSLASREVNRLAKEVIKLLEEDSHE